MYQIEVGNPDITRYININDIYRIHPTVYIGFDNQFNQLYRQYRDTIWIYASDHIENLDIEFQDQTFLVKADENFRSKSFFLIKKSDIVEEGYTLWNCMVYVIKNQEDIVIPSIISSCSLTCY